MLGVDQYRKPENRCGLERCKREVGLARSILLCWDICDTCSALKSVCSLYHYHAKKEEAYYE